MTLFIPLIMTYWTAMPSVSTNNRNDRFTERTISATDMCRRLKLRSANTEEPANVTQADPHRFRDHEPGTYERHHQDKHRWPRRESDLLGVGWHTQIAGENW